MDIKIGLTDTQIAETIYRNPKRIVGWRTHVTPRDRKITKTASLSTLKSVVERIKRNSRVTNDEMGRKYRYIPETVFKALQSLIESEEKG